MSLPTPAPGLVIGYSYLWHAEHREGREEGVKDRPCAIVLAVEDRGRQRVVVLAVTHTPPKDPALAIELPAITKSRLGLDGERSWIILDESNEFLWPGPDLRRAGKSATYGFLPPAFFSELKRRFVALAETGKTAAVKRTE